MTPPVTTDGPSRDDEAVNAPAVQRSSVPVETGDDPLILWMLSLTPTQRLEVAQGFADSIFALRNGRRT
jgi:hypothetical protein